MSTNEFTKGNDNGFETVKNSNGKRIIDTPCRALLCDRLKKVRMPSNKNCSVSMVSEKLKSCGTTSSASAAGKTKTVTVKKASSSSSYSTRLRAPLSSTTTCSNPKPKPVAAWTSSLIDAGDNLHEPALIKSCHQERQKRNQFSADKQESSDQDRRRGRVYRKVTVPIPGGGSQVSQIRQPQEKLNRIAPRRDTRTELYEALFGSCEQDCSDHVNKGGPVYRKFTAPVTGGRPQVSKVRRQSPKKLTRIEPRKATKPELSKSLLDSDVHDDTHSHRTNPEVPAVCSRAKYMKREREAARVNRLVKHPIH